MTRQEIVTRAIEFRCPPRIPFYLFVSGPSDVFHVRPGRSSDPRESDPVGGSYTDRFGCRFDSRGGCTMGQPCEFPLPDIGQLGSYRFPDPRDPARFSGIEATLKEAADSYVACDLIWFTFFERMHFLHGFARTLEDLLLDRDRMADFADAVTEYNVASVLELDRRFHGRVHGIAMSDDWGSQSATFIDPGLFREFFLPRYKRLFAVIRDHGMHVWFHSCGYVADFIPAFIESGVQVLNLQQPRIFDLPDLGRRFAGAVCFNVPVDIQATMPTGSRVQIRAEAAELVRCLATPAGGLVASEHPDYAGNGIDPIKGIWAYEAFRDADPYTEKGAVPPEARDRPRASTDPGPTA